MDFEFYRNFITVAKTGNITTAAQKLSLAQPALTAQIKTLEQYYGAKLIETGRGKRHLELTEAGRAFFEKAHRICEEEENIALDMLSFSKQAARTLRFSVSPAKASFFISNYLLPFAEQYPNVDYQFHAEAVTQQIKQLQNNAVDFAFANAPLPSVKGFACHKASKESFYAVRDRSAAKSAEIYTPGDLRDAAVCCTYGNYKLLRRVCRKYNFTPKIHFISNTSVAVLDFIRGTDNLAVVTLDDNERLPSEFTAFKIIDDDLYFEQTLYWSEQTPLSSAAQEFLKFYKRQK